jgi:DnaJ domain
MRWGHPSGLAAGRVTRWVRGRILVRMDIAHAARILGLDPGTITHAELHAAWRRHARGNHPDTCPGDIGAIQRFIDGRAAYETLCELLARTGDAPPRPRVHTAARGRSGMRRAPVKNPRVAPQPYAFSALGSHDWRV